MKKGGIVVAVVFMSNLLVSLNSFAQAVPSGVPTALLDSATEALARPYLLGQEQALVSDAAYFPDAENQEVIQAAANDAADFLNGGEETPLLIEVDAGMRSALAKGGDKATYSDEDLAHMIIRQADY